MMALNCWMCPKRDGSNECVVIPSLTNTFLGKDVDDNIMQNIALEGEG